MTETGANQPQINRTMNLIGLFGCSTAYALLLNTRWGRRWAEEQTWATVVAGTLLTTGFISFENKKAAHTTITYFFVAGIPIVIRSLWLQLERIDRAYQHLTGKGEG